MEGLIIFIWWGLEQRGLRLPVAARGKAIPRRGGGGGGAGPHHAQGSTSMRQERGCSREHLVASDGAPAPLPRQIISQDTRGICRCELRPFFRNSGEIMESWRWDTQPHLSSPKWEASAFLASIAGGCWRKSRASNLKEVG